MPVRKFHISFIWSINYCAWQTTFWFSYVQIHSRCSTSVSVSLSASLKYTHALIYFLKYNTPRTKLCREPRKRRMIQHCGLCTTDLSGLNASSPEILTPTSAKVLCLHIDAALCWEGQFDTWCLPLKNDGWGGTKILVSTSYCRQDKALAARDMISYCFVMCGLILGQK
jgi:hypothetical protein